MRRICLSILLLSTLAASAQNPEPLNLMPMPSSVTANAGRFPINPGFTISIQADPKDTLLYEAVGRMPSPPQSKSRPDRFF